MIYVIFEKKDDGNFGWPTFVSKQSSAEEAVDHFLDEALRDTYRQRTLIVAPLDAFDEFEVKPQLHVESRKWSIDG